MLSQVKNTGRKKSIEPTEAIISSRKPMKSARVQSATSNQEAKPKKTTPRKKTHFPLINSTTNLDHVEAHHGISKHKTTSATLYRIAKKNLKQMYDGSNTASDTSLLLQPEKNQTDEENEGSLDIIQEAGIKPKANAKATKQPRNKSSGETRVKPTDPFELEHELMDQDGNLMSVKDFISDAMLMQQGKKPKTVRIGLEFTTF